MKLFLASLAEQTLDLAIPLFSDAPNKLRVAFVATAADTYDNKPWVLTNRNKLVEMGFSVEDYDLKGKTTDKLCFDLSKFQVICVTGGNTYYLLNEVRKSGFDTAIKYLLDKGIVYVGSSAGSCIMCPAIEHVEIVDHKELVPELTDYTGIGLVKELIVPHFGRAKYADRHAKIREQWGERVTFLRDGQAILVNGETEEIVSSQETHEENI